ncbi:MAG: serine/threonine protein kinase [Myxococcales bacterium]|nr:serine/threonine protein kinase [Myxococcales bacterium]
MGPSSDQALDGLPEPGTVIGGKYRIERVLGVGGMGAVLLAEHEQLGEPVAIKFLIGSAKDDSERTRRFAREAWAAAKIKSEHAVRVLDVAATEDGTPYLVMEYLEGSDLEELLHQRGALSVETAVDYVLQAAEALVEAHKLGIIHRDLKPGNLHVGTRPDGTPWVKVLDFGISKLVGGRDNMTKTSTLMGSPLYMAPEQLASAKHVDARADIWALAVILYELISGELPFMGDTLPQICTAVLHSDPRPLPEVVPHVPPELWQVLEPAFEKLPEDRYDTLTPLARALAPFGGASARASAAYVARVLGDAPLPDPLEDTGSFRSFAPRASSPRGSSPHAEDGSSATTVEKVSPLKKDFAVPARTAVLGSATSAPVVSDSLIKTRPSRRLWVAAALAVLGLVTIVVVVATSGGSDETVAGGEPTEPSAGLGAAPGPESPPVTPSSEPSSEPSSDPSSSAEAEVAEEPPATPSASVVVPPKPTPRVRTPPVVPRVAVPPPPPPEPTPRSKDDYFKHR